MLISKDIRSRVQPNRGSGRANCRNSNKVLVAVLVHFLHQLLALLRVAYWLFKVMFFPAHRIDRAGGGGG